MLRRLYIENFALVDKLEINLNEGMSVLTGETGAGKSVIVGAISRLLGEKADKDDIRSGAKTAVIEGDFEIGDIPGLKDRLNEIEIEYDAGVITLRKEIDRKRSARSFINSRLLALAQMRDITRYLAELFGQHSHQLLLDQKNHLSFLDHFAGLTNTVDGLRQLFQEWDKTKKELARLETRKQIEKNERELLLFQKEEITKAKIRAGEEEELLAEKKILDSSHLLGEKSTAILDLLDGDETSALSVLSVCRKEFAQMANLDKSLEKNAELLGQSIVNLEELRTEIEAYLSSIPDDPERLEQINLRLDEIYRLKKKYGGSEDAVLSTLEKINDQLAIKIDIDDRIKMLKDDEVRLLTEYTKLASEVSKARKQASERLARVVERELKQLGIDPARFQFEFIYEYDRDGVEIEGKRVKPGPEGLETGRFLISANPGEPLKPLAKTASGGEISRIMLALKAADRSRPGKTTTTSGGKPLLVFDEIDSGIGGRTANAVAGRLADLADEFQLLVITHLHQIASVSHHHFAVAKVDSDAGGKRKVISVKRLESAERKKEIQRMLSLPEDTT
jgi:DNA repair protein RecN (Recombination protein N)